MFESAAGVYRQGLTGIILKGVNKDFASGPKKVKKNGGLTITQDPEYAEVKTMPEAAIKSSKVGHVLPLSGILDFLKNLK